jgi:hypothetical protein
MFKNYFSRSIESSRKYVIHTTHFLVRALKLVPPKNFFSQKLDYNRLHRQYRANKALKTTAPNNDTARFSIKRHVKLTDKTSRNKELIYGV